MVETKDGLKIDIKILKKNESTVILETNNRTCIEDLKNYFSARAPNYRFHPLYKQGLWDGYIRIFTTTHELPIGLLEEFYLFCKKGNYTYSLSFDLKENNISESDFQKFISTLNLQIEPRDYQVLAALKAINKKHINIKSVTSSGKSLILYLIIRWMILHQQRTLLIVPTINLVHQMYTDFESYGWENASDKCSLIYGGQKRLFDKSLSISTWQILITDSKKVDTYDILSNFDCVIIDEAHLAAAKSLQTISKACTKAKYRIGCSGTYPEYHTADWFTITGALGPIVNFTSYKDLQDKGYISNLKIYSMILQYSPATKREVYNASCKNYQEETDLVHGNEDRLNFIVKMAKNLNQNTLILFTKREKHGHPLLNLLKTELKDEKLIYYIDGTIEGSEREKIRQLTEKHNNVVLLASYGVFSTGVSIKNIHHLIFASGYKSKVKVLQSIGRALRKHDKKTHATLYDLIDNISFQDKKNDVRYINYSMKHYKERKKIYEGEGFAFKEIKFDIK